jgi:putative solute:sodium symporter small subunit
MMACIGYVMAPSLAPPMDKSDNRNQYWKRNLRYVGVLLTVWFVVSFGCGILFVDRLDTIRVGGFKLGFWFAQQGSIYVFVVLIFVYVFLMNRLDRKFDVDELGASADRP